VDAIGCHLTCFLLVSFNVKCPARASASVSFARSTPLSSQISWQWLFGTVASGMLSGRSHSSESSSRFLTCILQHASSSLPAHAVPPASTVTTSHPHHDIDSKLRPPNIPSTAHVPRQRVNAAISHPPTSPCRPRPATCSIGPTPHPTSRILDPSSGAVSTHHFEFHSTGGWNAKELEFEHPQAAISIVRGTRCTVSPRYPSYSYPMYHSRPPVCLAVAVRRGVEH